MKKFLLLLVFISIVSISGYYYHQNIYLPSKKPTIDTENKNASITDVYIYGTHLNIKGIIKNINANFKDVDLVFWNIKNGKKKAYRINYKKNVTTIKFDLSDEINDGLYLDDINRGNYELYLRLSYQDKIKTNNKKTYKYYPLNNESNYKKTTYYTTSKTNNKILINKNSKTMTINIAKSNEKNYDVVIDPTAGGIDKGKIANNTNEAIITLDIAEKIKTNLEKNNITVKLTRTKDSLKENEYFDEYNKGGRAIISHEVNAKYQFSLQVNSSKKYDMNGFSIYTAANINYDFAAKMVENIINKTNLKTSTTTSHRIDYGIYTHNFTQGEIAENMAYYKTKGYKAYNVTTNSNYMYMIRESGGILTGAYIDNSNPEKVGVNEYYNSNVGVESYIIDLGYITNNNDLSAMTNNKDAYAEAISNSIIEELKK